MRRFLGGLKRLWLGMLLPPWRYSGRGTARFLRWTDWLIGWAWWLAGLVLGALVAPSLVQWVGFSYPQYQEVLVKYQDWLVIAVAVLAGFVVNLLAWGLNTAISAPVYALLTSRFYNERARDKGPGVLVALVAAPVVVLIDAATVLIPLAGVGYASYRYLTWVGAGQRSITVAFVGALLVKTFLIPFIKSLVTGALFKWFLRWLRGGNKAKPA